jgi:ABC-type dipeptide/oligopeptide/nickel transport system permease subunit
MVTFEAAVDRGILAAASPGRSPAAAAWRRLVASPAARAGLVMVVVFVLVALVTPLVHVYDARTDANLGLRLKPPTSAHPFGTDSLGRDILVRVLHATRVSLGLAMSAVALAALIGSALGFVAGYLRGRVDLVVMFCMDIVLASHIVPNSLPPLIVQTTLSIAFAILEAAALGFLGLGAQPPTPEWGAMLADSYRYFTSGAWWVFCFPGAAIMLSVLGFNLLGDGLRDALDPRLGRG